MPVNVTAPLPALYIALAPPGKPVTVTFDRPVASVNVYVVPADVDGPAFR